MKSKRIIAGLLIVSMLVAMAVSTPVVAFAQGSPNLSVAIEEDAFIERLESKYADPEGVYRPGTRWWMALGLHTNQTIKEEIEKMSNAGYGSVEILCLDESGIDAPRYSWGSPEWIADTKLIIEETTKRGMGFSLTSGAHWGNANIPNTYEYEGKQWNADHRAAAQRLHFTNTTVTAGATYSGTLGLPAAANNNANRHNAVTVFNLVSVVAMKSIANASGTNRQRLDYESSIVLEKDVHYTWADGAQTVSINWTAPNDGDYVLFAFWMYGAHVTATPSYATNYAINYVDPYGAEAMKSYWADEVLTEDLRDLIKENGRGEMYMDSLEVELSTSGQLCGVFWGFTFLEEFQKRRGYDLTPYLPFLIRTGSGSSLRAFEYTYNWHTGNDNSGAPEDFVNRVRNDYYQTITELYIDNVLKPLQEWCHSFGMKLRAEISFGGLFYETSLPGKYVDAIETESYEFGSQIDGYRNLSGVAHLYGRPYSIEMGAYSPSTHGGLYCANLDFYTQIINVGFASGISRNIMHGWSGQWGSSTTTWPGHHGMSTGVTERLDDRQPGFILWKDWMSMISRNQKALSQGKPRMDIGILRTDYMVQCLRNGINYETRGLRADAPSYWDRSLGTTMLQDAGYTYDYFTPMILEDPDIVFEDGLVQPDGPGYQALIIYQEEMQLDAAKRILGWAKEGLPVVIVNNTFEVGRPVTSGWTAFTAGTAGALTQDRYQRFYTNAASQTPFNDGNDAALKLVMDEMKALGNVSVLDNQADTIDALQELGVYARTEFSQPNKNILTFTRLDEDAGELYMFAYNYMYSGFTAAQGSLLQGGSPFTTEISIDALGKPYILDAWTGESKALNEYRIEDGRTVVEITLNPGETTMVVLDLNADPDYDDYVISSDAYRVLSSDNGLYLIATESGTYNTELRNGETIATTVIVPENISPEWDLEVESWRAGSQILRTEDRDATFPGGPYTTTEYKYDTIKTPITVDQKLTTPILPWAQITDLIDPGAATNRNVSGIGTYTTSFVLPDGWNSERNGMLFDLSSTNGSLTSVSVNGEPGIPVNFNDPIIDITDLLKTDGPNTIEVTATSPLGNAAINNTRQPYGMTGDVKLIPYTINAIAVTAGIRADAASVAVNAPASYTVSLGTAQGAGVVSLSLTADSRYLNLTDATPLNGFTILDPLTWEYIGSQMWKGTVKLYCPGFVQNDNPLDILKISGVALDLIGDTTVTLTGFAVTGDVNGTSGVMPSAITAAEAVTSVVAKAPVYSKYDLNHDGKIDDLDLAIVVFYYLANDLEADWEVVKFDIASAKDCDVALNGRVDLADMIEVIANYCDSYDL
ncbi:MAG: hypothetical protein FWH55_09050 [Oscillospiraceae bacterium]|nr:hypothetical protein [Oscillospiraceae bacterium]